jgi:predicted nucleotidyltransferase
MFGLPEKDISAMQQCFTKYPSIEEVIIYGSRAKGNFRNGSDIDLTITGNTDFSELLRLENELDDLLLPYKIDLSLKTTINNPELLEHIERVGSVFYNRLNNALVNEPPAPYENPDAV